MGHGSAYLVRNTDGAYGPALSLQGGVISPCLSNISCTMRAGIDRFENEVRHRYTNVSKARPVKNRMREICTSGTVRVAPCKRMEVGHLRW